MIFRSFCCEGVRQASGLSGGGASPDTVARIRHRRHGDLNGFRGESPSSDLNADGILMD
jgi:hypothetical protein